MLFPFTDLTTIVKLITTQKISINKFLTLNLCVCYFKSLNSLSNFNLRVSSKQKNHPNHFLRIKCNQASKREKWYSKWLGRDTLLRWTTWKGEKSEIRGRFHQHFMQSFFASRFQKHKKDSQVISVFLHFWGSAHTKADLKTLVKLTHSKRLIQNVDKAEQR